MGVPKALLDIGGRTALERVASALSEGGVSHVTVVVGRHAAEIRAAPLHGPVTFLEHTGWARGRTSSIRRGLASLPPDAPGVVLALTDMPFVRPDTVARLLAAFDEHAHAEVLVPLHDGVAGHPIVLRSSLFPKILALGDDTPLRDFLRARNRRVVHVDDPGTLLDVDTPDDLARARDTLGER